MTTYVALLRGIGPGNPNMHNEKLRQVFEDLGFNDIRSVISSGNIIFQSSEKNIEKLEQNIEKSLKDQLGINSPAIVKNADEVKLLLESRPYGSLEHDRKTYLLTTFLKSKPQTAPKSGKNIKENYEILGYDATSRAIFSVIDVTGSKTPDFLAMLEKKFGKSITSRTWKTIEKINSRMSTSTKA